MCLGQVECALTSCPEPGTVAQGRLGSDTMGAHRFMQGLPGIFFDLRYWVTKVKRIAQKVI